MYKKESQFNQKPLSLKEISTSFGQEEATLEDRRDSLRLSIERINAELSTIRTIFKSGNNDKKLADRRKSLIARKNSLEDEMLAIKRKLKIEKKLCSGLASFFIDVAKEELDKFKFDMIMDEAKKRLFHCQKNEN